MRILAKISGLANKIKYSGIYNFSRLVQIYGPTMYGSECKSCLVHNQLFKHIQMDGCDTSLAGVFMSRLSPG